MQTLSATNNGNYQKKYNVAPTLYIKLLFCFMYPNLSF